MKRSTKTKAWNAKYIKQGMKLIFFPDSHLAPEFFKVVANPKLLAIFKDKQNLFSPLSAF